jgi:entericidin B
MKVPSIFAALFALSMLASCNTVRGAGQDVQAGGAAVEEAATEVQEELKDE